MNRRNLEPSNRQIDVWFLLHQFFLLKITKSLKFFLLKSLKSFYENVSFEILCWNVETSNRRIDIEISELMSIQHDVIPKTESKSS